MDSLPVLGFVAYVIYKIVKGLGLIGGTGKAWKSDQQWEKSKPWEINETKQASRPAIPLRRTEKRIAPVIIKQVDITRQVAQQEVWQEARQEYPQEVRQEGLTRQNNDLTPDYREQEVTPSVPVSLEEQTNPWLELLTGDNLVQGMVLKEILQPPRALRPFSLQRR